MACCHYLQSGDYLELLRRYALSRCTKIFSAANLAFLQLCPDSQFNHDSWIFLWSWKKSEDIVRLNVNSEMLCDKNYIIITNLFYRRM